MSKEIVKKDSSTGSYVKGLGTGVVVGGGTVLLVGTIGFIPALLVAGGTGGYLIWKRLTGKR